jgi:hypothetical protein
MPILSETEKNFDKGYVLFRYSGVYDDDYISRGIVALLAVASREEILNLRAVIADLNAVSEVTMVNTDASINNLSFRKLKKSLELKNLDIQEIAPNVQRFIICPAHLRGAWSERTERVQTAIAWRTLPEIVFFDTREAAVAAVNLR